MSSRSAGGRRRQLKASGKTQAAPPLPTPRVPSYTAHNPTAHPPLDQSQMYIQPYVQPSPEAMYQPFSSTVHPISPSPLTIAPHDDKRWYQQQAPPKDIRFPSPVSDARGPYVPMRVPSPSSADTLTPTAMSFSSMSISSASSTLSPAPTYTTLSPTMTSPTMHSPTMHSPTMHYPVMHSPGPGSSPPSLSPVSMPNMGNIPPPLLFQQFQQPQQPQQPLQQVLTRSSGDSSPQGFVYPTCRSGARPSNRSPTSASFPKINLKSKKKKGNGDGPFEDGKGSEKDQHPAGGRFRALLKRSKKKKTITPILSAAPTPLPPEPIDIAREPSLAESTNDSVESFAWIKKQEQLLHPFPNEAPYMQAYDPPLLDNDRQFTNLLRRLTPRESPCFHDYGRHPPVHVLDIGCGTGSWALEAATFWKSQGTRITGFDMVDLAREEWARTRDGSVVQNLRFVRGNFLMYRLPFPDRTFDLVRMANLTLCIPYSKWEPVLAEVRRVMTIGGRLELIDDQLIFPYARPFSPSSSSTPSPRPPKLDISIPSSSFSIPPGREYEENSYDLENILEQDDSDVEGDDASSSTPTIAGSDASSRGSRGSSQRQLSSNGSIPRSRRSAPRHPPTPWDRQAGAAQGLETVFENMLNERYHIHPRPSEFLLDVMKRVFGKRHSSLMRSMHLELAPTELHFEDAVAPLPTPGDYGAMAAAAAAANSSRARGRVQDALSQCPGVMLWPSTFIPIPRSELESHACKHVRTLLGCKAALADYVELRDHDGVRVVDEEFWDAMFDYESFVRQRFEGLPRAPEARLDPSQAHARAESIDTLDSASTYQESVLEYQSIFRNRFDLGNDRTEPPAEVDSIMIASPTGVFQNYDGLRASVVPPYTPQELTHIRTIRVYEALKLSEESHS